MQKSEKELTLNQENVGLNTDIKYFLGQRNYSSREFI